MNDNTTDKLLLLTFTVILLGVGIYVKDPQVIGGSLVAAGYAVRAIASRVAPTGEVGNVLAPVAKQ